MERRSMIIITVVVLLVLITYLAVKDPINNIVKNKSIDDLEDYNETVDDIIEENEDEVEDEDESEEINESEEFDIIPYKNVFPKEANALINDNSDLIIIDVSTRYDDGHLIGAVNYPLDNGSLESEMVSLNKSKKYLVYARTDAPSKKASQILVDNGFKEVYRLQGSYGLWIQEGYGFEK